MGALGEGERILSAIEAHIASAKQSKAKLLQPGLFSKEKDPTAGRGTSMS